ncbi:hypothetical protein [Actinoalloteichus hymeniacidonis]|uniref:hypothetical protein n=1 Tax=Actinoalloteichus hymeniacidonis TaxID=340345 RepID=UPI0012FC6A6B|nr:hypothetical protein [Actinoalloteichus hymeniacidonis]MBB5906061.1 hypothetical protein [Actinoalloteichus hymeniacidonis]
MPDGSPEARDPAIRPTSAGETPRSPWFLIDLSSLTVGPRHPRRRAGLAETTAANLEHWWTRCRW